jgi:small Trp-rich protein
MYFVIAGVLLIALNLLGVGPFGAWNWEFTGDLWKFIAPFLLAALWWAWADKSGLNKRREMEKMDARKEKRRRENLANMGLDYRTLDKDKERAKKFKAVRQLRIDEVEGKRSKQREENRDSILGSSFDSRHDSRSPAPGVTPPDDAKH